jgi:uncharacterized membrane protein
MNTKLLMILNAIFMAGLGACASFLPQEIASHFGSRANSQAVLLLQIVGALYLGFAILNLMKAVAAGFRAPEILVAAAIYSFIAIGFGRVVFTSPRARPS